MRSSRFFAFSSLVVAFVGGVDANVFGPIAMDAPAPAGGSVANDQPPTSFFQGHSPPFPTNSWWAGYGAGAGDAMCAGPFPFESSLSADSIQFGVSTSRQFDGTSIKQPTQTDWSVGFVEHSGNMQDHKALSWDSQSVTLQYFTGSSTLTAYMVPGSPYLTFDFKSATPRFLSGAGFVTSLGNTSVSSNGRATVSGTKFIVSNNIGAYLIYSLSGPITFNATNSNGAGTIVASRPFTGVLRVAKLDQASHEALLDQYVANYATAVETDYSFSSSDPTAVLRFTWSVVGNADELLMLTWPHHRITMQSPNFPSTDSLNYLTTKGYMYPALGNIWNLEYALPTMDFSAPRAPDSSCTAAIIQGLEYEIANLGDAPVPGDFYYWGGSIAAMARLALIADEVGRSDLIPTVLAYLETSYEYWFLSSSTTLPAYETAWGGIIDAAGFNNVNVDFGNGYYNDHHFHYGYFLTGAAVIAKYDSNWLSQHQTYVNWFLRDIINPTNADPYFPVTRHRDWFAGHSWASGIANGAGSRDQESVGEAVNAYYGAMLWAIVIGDTDIKNYARLLLASEQHAAQTYWHMYPEANSTGRDQPYPDPDVRSLVTIGNVQDWQSGAWLFWGSQKVEIAAIQMLPVTPVNENMYDAAWVENVYQYASDEISDPTISDDWKSVIYLAYSQYDLKTAAQLSSSLTSWGTGNTFTNQLYFLSTRPNPSGGAICSSTYANPLGNFTIQAAASGKYVVSSASNTNLVASSTSRSSAAVFNSGFAPNGGTLQLKSTSQFVTADQSGNYTLASIRGTASSWEVFIMRPKVGAATNVYSIRAASNRLYVTVGSDGGLINNAVTEAASAGFILTAA